MLRVKMPSFEHEVARETYGIIARPDTGKPGRFAKLRKAMAKTTNMLCLQAEGFDTTWMTLSKEAKKETEHARPP